MCDHHPYGDRSLRVRISVPHVDYVTQQVVEERIEGLKATCGNRETQKDVNEYTRPVKKETGSVLHLIFEWTLMKERRGYH